MIQSHYTHYLFLCLTLKPYIFPLSSIGFYVFAIILLCQSVEPIRRIDLLEIRWQIIKFKTNDK